MSVSSNLPPVDSEPNLYAVIYGEPILLEGHLEKGIMGVIHDIAAERGVNVADLPRPIQILRDEQEPVLQ